MKIKAVFLLVPLIFSACIVFHSGNVSSGPLISINDQYKGTVGGTARTVSVLNFGDAKPRLIADAKKSLLVTRLLNSDEYFSNFTVDIRKTLIFGMVTITKATVSADVMQNRSEPRPNLRTFVQSPKSKKEYFISGTDTFRLGETVYCTRNKSYYNRWRLSHVYPEKAGFLDESTGVFRELKISKNFFYSTINIVKGFRPGDSIVIENFDPISIKKSKKSGVILGLNSSEALIRTGTIDECHPYEAINKLTE